VRTVRHYVDLQARERAARPYLISPESGRELTFGQLAVEARKLCGYLMAEGLRPGDRVAFYCGNGRQAAVVFLGAMYGGFISVPLNLLAQPAQLEYVVGHSGARIVFADRENALRVAGHGVRVIVIDVDAESLFKGPEGEPAAPAEDAPCLLMYTSGTTGRPKGCLHTQRSVVSGALYVQQAHALTEQDRVLSSLPLYHINGQIVATVGPLVHGASVVAPRRFSVKQFWEQLARHECTWFNVVPTIISYLVAGTESAGQDLRRVRFGRSASAPLPPELHRDFERKFGISIIETMGMTETAAPIFSNPLDPAKRKYGSVGVPVGNQARVRDGELQVRGDNLMREYYRDPEQTAKAFTPDGWLRTGDLGHVDAEGYYFITGRLKELIIKGGENIAPREIDDALYKHPAVLEAAAVGVPDAHYGQEILAAVVLKPGARASEAELRAFCERELGRYKTPKQFRFMDELPKGPSGKVQRLKLV
jgi:acyl-CoA synthetase (AMP-forming)/AMP-acid ligase II